MIDDCALLKRSIRHVILDRDGVLNVEAADGRYITSLSEWTWTPGALEALTMLSRRCVRISVATNQSAVGRGLMTAVALAEIHARMVAEARVAGARIAAVFACIHAPTDGCYCRKPKPGLIERAIRASAMPAAQTLMIGDDVRDLFAATRAEVPAALVLTGKGGANQERFPDGAFPVFSDLLSFVRAARGEGIF